MKNTLLIVGGLGAAYYLAKSTLNTANAVKRLDFTNPRIKIGKASLSGIELLVTMDFNNQSSQAVSMEYFTGYVLYQGRQFSSFTFDGKGQNIVLKARSITPVSFTVLIKNIATVSALIKLISNMGSGQSVDTVVTIDGSFYAAGIDVPIKFGWDLRTNSLVSIAPAANKVSGIGGIGKDSILIKWSQIDQRFYVEYLGVEIGHKKSKPTKEDIISMLEKSGFITINKISGIGSTATAKLTFNSNDEMVNYFRQEQIKQWKPRNGFSKN